MSGFHKHHRKRRSQGGDDSYGNAIDLPPAIHEAVHREPEAAYEHGLLVRETDDPGTIRPDIPGFMAALGMEGEPEQKPKPRKRLAGDERRKRRTISLKVPNDAENGGEVYDETLERVKERLVAMGLYEDGAQIPAYEAWIACANDWLNS